MNKEFARIRAIRKRRIGKKDSSSISWTDSEPYALCYYLYHMFDSKSNRRIIDSFDSAIKLFMECTTLLNETERLSKVLKKEIKNLDREKAKGETNAAKHKRPDERDHGFS